MFILSLTLLSVISCGGKANSPTQTPQPTTIAPPYAVINKHNFHLEIAADEASRELGLGNRTYLAQDSAMLFIFPDDNYRYFWMKDTLLPLDILFLDSSRKIVDIQTMQTEPGVPDNKLHTYRSSAPAMYAIEMNAGLATQLGFTVGMVVELNIHIFGSTIRPGL